MKRQLTSILLFSALLVGGASTFVSCTDHESDSAYNTSVSLADAIAQQKAKLAQVTEDLQNLTDQTDAIKEQVAANKRLLTETALAGLAQYATLDEALQSSEYLNGQLEGIRGEIQAINDLYASDKEAAQAYKAALEEKLAGLDEAVANEAEAREALQKEYDKAFDYLINKKLDNIAINATENPVTGYWNAAFLGSQLNLASSFYGVTAEGNEDWGVTANQVLGKNGNAGYLYVSLNPTEIEPSLVKVELVNSQGEPAKGFKLGDIQETDKVLTYGYTRASKNGFYEIPVIASDPQNDDIALDKGSLKEAAQAVLGELKNPKANDFDLTKVAAALYKNNLNNKLTAYTVKATYHLYDPSLKKLVEKHAVAQYNVAAFAVKPLSFNFAKDNQYLDKLSDWSMENLLVPSLSNKLKNFVNGIKVDVTYEGNKEINVYTILAAPGVHASAIKADGSVDLLDGDNVLIKNIPNVSEVTNKSVDTTVAGSTLTTNIIVLKSTDDSISKVLESVNNSIAKQLDPIKDKITNAGEKWDNMASKVNTVLKKVYSKIGSANRLLEPTILYLDNNNNPNTLSTLGGRLGTRFVGLGSTTLYATSWTAELLAPAYLKSVYVVEDGAEITLADGKTSAKTPFDGTRLIFTAKKTGKYTIVYKAVDYSGIEVEKTFNVNVVAE
uniref:hypothetical protein n=1 Tax=Segatella copri TaxID=165179 RepID=UPI003FEDE16E